MNHRLNALRATLADGSRLGGVARLWLSGTPSIHELPSDVGGTDPGRSIAKTWAYRVSMASSPPQFW